MCVFVVPPAHSQTETKPPAGAAKKSRAKPAAGKVPKEVTENSADTLEKALAQLSRALHDHPNATSYAALSAFSTRNAKSTAGARAALALGYYDLQQDKPEAALNWLKNAAGDKLLREYTFYWQAQATLALGGSGQKEAALEQFQHFRREFPESTMTEQAVTSLAQTAVALGRGEDALAALKGYPNTETKPALLLLRAQAHEQIAASKSEPPAAAAPDYLDIYYRFPLNDEAKSAGQKIPALRSALGESFPGVPMQTQFARAEAFYLARRWSEAKSEFAGLLPNVSGVEHQRAELRIAQCEVESGGSVEKLKGLPLSDPDLDAERLFSIEQAYRTQKMEAPMLEDVELLAKQYPHSSWTGEALFGVGNFYWVNLDHARAAEFYRRSLEASHDGTIPQSAAWRVAWLAYMDRKPEAADMIEAYVRQFPSSNNIPDALYWLGRAYERSGDTGHARSFYLAAANRFPLTYFGERAAERVRPEPDGIGSSPVNIADFISVIPVPAPLPDLDSPIGEGAAERAARARALSQIAFDASAELEYRAAYAESHAPKLLVEAAVSGIAAGHYGAAMSTIRQTFPQLEARHIPDIPQDAWRAAYPLPYEEKLRSASQRNQVDPMLVAGLIRQESSFESKAMSRAGAVGLMQMMPSTARLISRQINVRYQRNELTEPGYNLQLGARYLANLIQSFGSMEAALAAYNAGEDRVTAWTAGQSFQETPEFVESIPFTETREYVQIVLRNAEVYRQIYRPSPAAEPKPAPKPSHRVRRVSAKGGAARSAAAHETRTAGAEAIH